jgi:hypothetical protein
MPIIGRYLAHVNDVVGPPANDIAEEHKPKEGEQDTDRDADADCHAEWFDHTDVRAAQDKTVRVRTECPNVSVLETIAQNPELAALAALILRAILAWQRGLSWPEYRALHGVKRVLFPVLNRFSPVFVFRKGGHNHPEFLGHSEAPPREVVQELRSAGFGLHLLASLKVRPERQATYAQLVMTHDDGTQTEVYAFRGSGGTAVYAHHERSAGSIRHLTDTDQVNGDPRGVVPEGIYG